jgi:hypothetical protein
MNKNLKRPQKISNIPRNIAGICLQIGNNNLRALIDRLFVMFSFSQVGIPWEINNYFRDSLMGAGEIWETLD